MAITDEPRATCPWLWQKVGRHIGPTIWWAMLTYAFLTIWRASWLDYWPLATLVIVPVLVWSMTFVHELGHALAARLCGWRVVVFAAGPLGVHVFNRQLAFIPRSKRSEFEGFVVPSPSRPEVWTRERDTLISLGGPLANLIVAAVLLSEIIDWPALIVSDSVDVTAIVASAGLISLGSGLSALVPDFQEGRPNDGATILSAFRDPHLDEPKWRAIARLHFLTNNGVRLRDLPTWMVEEARGRALANADVKPAYDALIIGRALDAPPVDTRQVRQMLNASCRSMATAIG